MHIVLDESHTIEATVFGRDSERAADALITTFRLIDPAQPRDSREPPPRRVFVAETVADTDGVARIDGLGDADYEVVAWHPRLGRASMLLPAGTARVTVRLQSPGTARGRVLAGGKPVAGVDVISVPDPAAYGAAQDPIDLKGGDARTALDGRFSLSLPSGGGGELRIGGGAYAVTRVALPRAPLPLVDLGDIELARAVAVAVVLDQGVVGPGPRDRTDRACRTADRQRHPDRTRPVCHDAAGRGELGVRPRLRPHGNSADTVGGSSIGAAGTSADPAGHPITSR